MEAKVLSVEIGKEFISQGGKAYNALSLITQGKPYKGQVKDPREHKMFTSNPLHDAAAKLKPGQWINYKCDSSRYKNMESFEIIGGSAATDQGTQTASTSFVKDISGTDASASIARAVALKASVECTTAMLSKDMFKKTAKPDFIANEILALAGYFEKYLTFSEEATIDSTDELLDTDDDLT